MKLFIIVVVALLTALCSAQPVDNSAPEQPDTGDLPFKRNGILPVRCPPGYITMNKKCTREMDAEHTDPNSAPAHADTSGIITNGCPPGNTNIGDICLPDYDLYYTEK